MVPRDILNIIEAYTASELDGDLYTLRIPILKNGTVGQLKVERKYGEKVRRRVLKADVYDCLYNEMWFSVRRNIIHKLLTLLYKMSEFHPWCDLADLYFYHEVRVRLDNIGIQQDTPKEVFELLCEGRDAQIVTFMKWVSLGDRTLFRGNRNVINYLLCDVTYSHQFCLDMQDEDFYQSIVDKAKLALEMIEAAQSNHLHDIVFKPFSEW